MHVPWAFSLCYILYLMEGTKRDVELSLNVVGMVRYFGELVHRTVIISLSRIFRGLGRGAYSVFCLRLLAVYSTASLRGFNSF